MAKSQDPPKRPTFHENQETAIAEVNFLDGIEASQLLSILNSAFDRLYSHNHYLRDKIVAITQAAMAVFLVSDGWLVHVFVEKSVAEDLRWLATIVFVIVTVAASWSVTSHWKEYVANAAMIVSLEEVLGFYDRSRFVKGRSIYSQRSKLWGKGKYSWHILVAHLFAIVVLGTFSAMLSWLL